MREFLISTKVPAFESASEDSAGTKVTERADRRAGSDLGVDGDRVRVDLGQRRNRGAASQDDERMNGHVRLELDLRIDPGRRRVDDRHAGEHVCAVDPVAQAGRDDRELLAGVDPLDLERIGRDVDGDAVAVADEERRSCR